MSELRVEQINASDVREGDRLIVSDRILTVTKAKSYDQMFGDGVSYLIELRGHQTRRNANEQMFRVVPPEHSNDEQSAHEAELLAEEGQRRADGEHADDEDDRPLVIEQTMSPEELAKWRANLTNPDTWRGLKAFAEETLVKLGVDSDDEVANLSPSDFMQSEADSIDAAEEKGNQGITPEWQRNLSTPGADQGARSGGPAPDGGYDFSYSKRPVDATEEVAEGDEREWLIGEEPDGSPRIEGLCLGDAVETVVPKSALTAERERREELERWSVDPQLHASVVMERDAHLEQEQQLRDALKKIVGPYPLTANRTVHQLRQIAAGALAPLSDRGEG